MTEAFTVGVIGHVDHGKTALVRALTGIETDRLREERERGLSIVLGFAYLETDAGLIDLIDVPGHEAFIRAMIAGATALDAILLCVAANEGVMPQSIEHFNIARLLGVQRGAVVITKTDLVDARELERVRASVRGFVADTFLEGAEIVDVSAPVGQGVDALRTALARLAASPVEREQEGRFFLPLDRVFTMRGFGLVGTGTLRGGPLEVGDTVEVMPTGLQARVRALQNHNEAVARACPGQRVAVNLRHVDREDVKRGDVLAPPGALVASKRIDVELSLLDDARAVRNGAIVRLLTGTTEAMARLRLLDRRELEPGETAMAQLDLDREIATRPTERFLIRSVSPLHTLGGGTVLEVAAKRHRRFDADVTARLETKASGELARIVELRLDESGPRGVSVGGLGAELGVPCEVLQTAVGALGAVAIDADVVVAAASYDTLLATIVDVIAAFHEEQPFRKGLDVGSLAGRLDADPNPAVLRHALHRLVEDGTISDVQGHLTLSGYDPFAGLSAGAKQLVGRMEQAFLEFGLEVPAPQTVVGTERSSQTVYRLLLDAGRLVRLRTYDRNTEIVVHAETLDGARRAIEREFPYPRAFALKDIRDLLGSTRKYVVPLMEHFDATGMTVRTGDLRRLRQ